MKKGSFKKIASGVLAGFLCLASVPVIPDLTAHAADYQKTFNQNGYDYEVWNQYGQGSITFDPGSGPGTYKCSWSNIHNILFRAGKKWNNNPRWNSLNGISVDYECDYHPNGNSYLCVYGWTVDPLVEYYIVDSYGSWRPPGTSGDMRLKGTITVDGGTYEVYAGTHDGPSIDPNVNHFNQYWSVRVDSQLRTKGTINIDKHFQAWENQFGMKMGGLHEVALNVEGWQSSGTANVTKNELTIGGGTTTGTDDPGTTTPTVEPDANGNYFTSGFESSTDNWEGRGNASVKTDSKNYYDGTKSLFVNGRTENWHGAAITLDSSAFVPGGTYSFSTAVLQKSGKVASMQLTLQQGKGDSATYTKIASVDANSGEWTKLENTKFTIPSGSSDMILYVESPDSYTDFYIDSVTAAKEGKSSGITTGKGTVDNTTSSTTTTPVSTDTGLKNVFSKYFLIGTAVSSREIQNNPKFILKHFNSITPENELKPQWIFDQQASAQYGNNVNPQVKLPSDTKAILDFAVKNNLAMRGHTLIWHSQTPTAFFRENFNPNGKFVSKEIMNQRIENWIKNVFATLKENYPTLNLYAYDVANECFADGQGGGLRQAGENGDYGQSPWTLIYGDDSFLEVAFAAARKYAPEGCKLFYNDYNEYEEPKITGIYNLCKKLYAQGNLDGIGMQSHLDTTYPGDTLYKDALKRFASIGCEIHVTELDATAKNGTSAEVQGAYLEKIVSAIKDCDNVTSLTFWGTNDGMSWRASDNPLIFDRSYNAKPAYNKIVALVDPSEYGEGYVIGNKGKSEETTTTTTTTTTATTTTSTVTTTQKTSDPTNDLPAVKKYGDANEDNNVNMADAVLVMQVIANGDEFGLGKADGISKQGASNADVYEPGSGLTMSDASTIQEYALEIISVLPQGEAQKKNDVTTTSTTKEKTTTTTTTTAAPKAETYITNSFETGADGWKSRGSASVATDSDNHYSGNSSLFVSSRSEYWQGASITLDPTVFKAGSSYSFNTAVLQGTGSVQNVKMTLQYDDASGKEQYDEIASVDAADKTWTALGNSEYTIPTGASNLVLYVELPKSYGNYYLDDFSASTAGTKSKIVTGQGVVDIKVPETNVDTSKKLVAISFDDGAVGTSPNASSMRIINAIAKEGWHATIFYVSDWIRGNDGEAEVKYAFQQGFEIANHTKTHTDLSTLSSSQIRSEYDQCASKLKSILGTDPSPLLRLPYLGCNGTVQSTLNDVPLITCAIDTGDWQNNATSSSVIDAIKRADQNGSLENAIVLCHETKDHTAEAMEYLVPYLKEKGYQIVTISELYEARGQQLKKGQINTRCN